MSEPKQLVEDYIKSKNMMQLAVVDKDGPWVVSLLYACDDQLNLYWISLPGTRHSKAVENEPKAAASIPVEFESGKNVVGMSLTGKVKYLHPANKEQVELYAEQMDRDQQFIDDMLSGKEPHRMYVFRPNYVKLFDRVNFPRGDEIREVHLN